MLLCEDEETGGVGASKFTKTQYVKELDVNYMVELDRRGSHDAVFYSCANSEFIDFICENTGYEESWGSYTDISTIMPVSKLCGVNLSCGYYKAHTTDEYVVYAEMMNTIEVVKKLVQIDVAEPFEYKEKKVLGNWIGGYSSGFGGWSGYGNPSSKSNLVEMAKKDKLLEREVIAVDDFGQEEILYAQGETKYECWFNLFLTYTDLCFDKILEYNFN